MTSPAYALVVGLAFMVTLLSGCTQPSEEEPSPPPAPFVPPPKPPTPPPRPPPPQPNQDPCKNPSACVEPPEPSRLEFTSCLTYEGTIPAFTYMVTAGMPPGYQLDAAGPIAEIRVSAVQCEALVINDQTNVTSPSFTIASVPVIPASNVTGDDLNFFVLEMVVSNDLLREMLLVRGFPVVGGNVSLSNATTGPRVVVVGPEGPLYEVSVVGDSEIGTQEGSARGRFHAMIPGGGAFWMDLNETNLQSSGAAISHYSVHDGALADFAVLSPDGSMAQRSWTTFGPRSYQFGEQLPP